MGRVEHNRYERRWGETWGKKFSSESKWEGKEERVEEKCIDQTLGCMKILGYMLFYKLIKE